MMFYRDSKFFIGKEISCELYINKWIYNIIYCFWVYVYIGYRRELDIFIKGSIMFNKYIFNV